MPTRLLTIALVSGVAVLGFVGCAANSSGGGDDIVLGDDANLTSTISLGANEERTINLTATTAGDVTVTLDCSPPADPDDQGPVVGVTAPTLGVDGKGPAPATPAGYWSHTGPMAAGQVPITLKNTGSAVSCRLSTTAVPSTATCRARNEWRSANTDHTHYRVGEQGAAAGWDPFPASGNHWGAWAKWDTVYDKPVKTGFVLHNLEHGGLVFSYKCSSPSDSKACSDARDQLMAIAQGVSGPRVIVTPDPSQPNMFAVRAWRYAYTSDCLDKQSASDFARKHYQQGREDTDADPPIPFDPSTTNVPCQDLMAAPDSCN
jgi:hypothetical protein